VHWKLLKNGDVGGKGGKETNEGVEQSKVKYTHSGDALRNSFAHQLKY
jgi:hypothetical protein